MNTLRESIEKWSLAALELEWAAKWVEGAIFPREMVYFLARSEVARVRVILESGRQDGYSTEILGAFGERTSCKIISLDFEDERERAAAARARLSKVAVECVQGDAFVETDRIVTAHAGENMALLFDGPKGYSAMAVMFASARQEHVKLIAVHNLHPGYAERALFGSMGNGPIVYEDESLESIKAWEMLRHAEAERAAAMHAGRSLDQSSLCVLTVDPSNRRRLQGAFHRGFGLFQPAFVSAGWSLGHHDATARLFYGTFRIAGIMKRFGMSAGQ